jgi:uncharacterized protein (TIGR00251 family)
MIKFSIQPDGIRFEVKVQPRSARNQINGEVEGVLKVKLTAPPVDGEANQALINFFSKSLGIPKKDVILLKGETSRNKLIEIKGLSPDEFIKKLNI